jgi:hypothetical protein
VGTSSFRLHTENSFLLGTEVSRQCAGLLGHCRPHWGPGSTWDTTGLAVGDVSRLAEHLFVARWFSILKRHLSSPVGRRKEGIHAVTPQEGASGDRSISSVVAASLEVCPCASRREKCNAHQRLPVLSTVGACPRVRMPSRSRDIDVTGFLRLHLANSGVCVSRVAHEDLGWSGQWAVDPEMGQAVACTCYPCLQEGSTLGRLDWRTAQVPTGPAWSCPGYLWAVGSTTKRRGQRHLICLEVILRSPPVWGPGLSGARGL